MFGKIVVKKVNKYFQKAHLLLHLCSSLTSSTETEKKTNREKVRVAVQRGAVVAPSSREKTDVCV
jgi:hypothetical protein